MDLIFEPSSGPLCSFVLAFRGGRFADPAGWEGLGRHAAELARRGAGSLARDQLDQRVDAMGASLDSSADRDSFTISGLCLARHLDSLVDYALMVAADPTMTEAEHDKLCRESRALLDQVRDDDTGLAQRFFTRDVFPGNPYARTGLGTTATLAQIADDPVATKKHWARMIRRDGVIVGLSGPLSQEQSQRVGERIKSQLPAGEGEAPDLAFHAPPAPTGMRFVIVDKPERNQAQVVFGHPTLAYNSSGFPALLTAETAFGGLFSSRLVQEIRAKEGWSYGVGSSLGRARGPLWLSADMGPSIDAMAQAMPRALAIFKEFQREGPSIEEFELARKFLVGSLPFSEATPRQRMNNAAQLAVYGLPRNYPALVIQAIQNMSHADAAAAAQTHFRPDDLLVTIATTAKHLDLQALEKHGSVQVTNWDSY